VLLYGGRYGLKSSLFGMKSILDRLVTQQYEELEAYTNYLLSRMGSQLDPSTVISNSYLHCVKIECSDQDTMKSYMLNTIKKQIMWSGSQSNREESVNSSDEVVNEIDDTTDLDSKIEQEKVYNRNKAYIEIYRSRCEDRVSQIVLSAYVDKGYNTARAMAKYFDIPVTSAHYMISDIKQKLREIQYKYDK
jgi:hypothetical protein